MRMQRDKSFVVTGGTSGIGLATARALVAEGARVCVAARSAEGLARVESELGVAWAVRCDLADEMQIESLADQVEDRWGALDGLVNNAGLAHMATLEDTDPSDWDQTFAVNVRAPYLLTRRLLPLLRKGRNPSVVNVSSTLAEKAIAGMAAYNASKAALNHLTRSLALEVAPTVRVNAVMPGVVDTPIHATRGLSADDVEAMGELHPLGRIGRAEDVADLVLFLLSERAAWMTGTVIPIDGGMMAT